MEINVHKFFLTRFLGEQMVPWKKLKDLLGNPIVKKFRKIEIVLRYTPILEG